jgi:hypothetical protein
MTRFGDEIGGLALELAWSLWSELGIDGTARRHDWQAIDLEPLLLYTAWIGPADKRLQSRSIEWSIGNFRITSAIRMRNLVRRASRSTAASFGRYAATVKVHANAPWPASGIPLARARSGPEPAPDLRRPSLIQLRLRALVGVSARAEVLRLLLADPERPQSVGQLAEGAAYTKGSVAQSLDMLTMARFVQVHPYGNRLVYRLSRPAEVRLALQWLPAAFPDWAPAFRIIESISRYARTSPSMRRLRAVQHEIAIDVGRLGVANLVPIATGPESIPAFERWALGFVADLSARSPLSPASPLGENAHVA